MFVTKKPIILREDCEAKLTYTIAYYYAVRAPHTNQRTLATKNILVVATIKVQPKTKLLVVTTSMGQPENNLRYGYHNGACEI